MRIALAIRLEKASSFHGSLHRGGKLCNILTRTLELLLLHVLHCRHVAELHESPEARQITEIFLHSSLIDGRWNIVLTEAQKKLQLFRLFVRQELLSVVDKIAQQGGILLRKRHILQHE